MVTFWLFTTVLVVCSLLFIWMPFFQRRRSPALAADLDRNAQNVEIFKGRLAELEKELNDNNLDPESFQALKRELEASLLVEVDDRQGAASGAPGALPLWLPLSLTLAVPAVALVLYFQWGASQKLMLPKQVVAADQAEHDMQNIETQIAKLQTQLAANPQNPEGWFMLARTFLALDRYQEAFDAFDALNQLVGDHPEILSQQAQTLYLLNNSRMTPAVQTLVDRALALNPNDPGTLGFLGIAAFEAGEYQRAIDHWQQTLDSDNPEINRAGLSSAIEQAQAELAKQGIVYQPQPALQPAAGAMAGDGEAAAAGNAEVKVLVALDADLQARVSDDTTVFVFAQPVSGARMPLAAVRMQIRDLPATVTLDDSQAMGPMAKISSVDEVLVRAMVSHAGTATAQPGDFYGSLGPVKVALGSEVIRLNIDQVIE